MFRNKSLILFLTIMTTLLILAACGSNSDSDSSESSSSESSSDEKIVLKLAIESSPEAPFTKEFVEPFMDRVLELTDQKVEFDFYPSEQLGRAADLLSLTKDKVTDIGYIATPYFTSEMPLTNAVVGLPGMYETAVEGSVAYFNLSQQDPVLETDYLSNGIRPLLSFMIPPYEVYTKGIEIKTPEDLVNLKIRTAGGISSELMDFAGATPVQVSSADMYDAFDKGIAEALMQYPVNLKAYSLGELVTNGTNGLAAGGGVVVLAINEEVYQSLPEDVQEALIQAGREVSESGSKLHQENNEKILNELIESGEIELYDISETKQQWQELFDEFNNHWKEQQNSEEFNKVMEIFQDEIAKIGG